MSDLLVSARPSLILPRRKLLAAGTGGMALWLAGGLIGRPVAADPMTQKWICTAADCPGHIYDPQEGDPTQGIPAGTPFEDLPSDWYCPDCGAAKIEYIPLG